MRRTKTEALRFHAKRRAEERFGITFNPELVANMIQRGAARFVRRRSNRVTVWDVDYKGEELRVLYDSRRHIPITVLTRKMK